MNEFLSSIREYLRARYSEAALTRAQWCAWWLLGFVIGGATGCVSLAVLAVAVAAFWVLTLVEMIALMADVLVVFFRAIVDLLRSISESA